MSWLRRWRPPTDPYVQVQVAPADPEVVKLIEALGGTVTPPVPPRLFHMGGVPCWEAPLPPWWHRCYVHTYSLEGQPMERCPCGSTCYDHVGETSAHIWFDKNDRRRGR